MNDVAALAPAAELVRRNGVRFPGESDDYRRARDALLAEEIELRRHIERVAQQRRALPPGPPVAASYRFIGEEGPVDLAGLFRDKTTLVTYSYMFGPQRERPCPMCTAFLGALDIPVVDISQRVAFAVLGRSPVARQLAFARERGWRNLRFFQTVGDDFARDYRGLAPDGSEWPALDVWTKAPDGTVRHFWASELGGTQDPGQDPRGAPDPTPLWNILDLTPAGRGSDWYPKLDYPT